MSHPRATTGKAAARVLCGIPAVQREALVELTVRARRCASPLAFSGDGPDGHQSALDQPCALEIAPRRYRNG
jgi:hypothetical protein